MHGTFAVLKNSHLLPFQEETRFPLPICARQVTFSAYQSPTARPSRRKVTIAASERKNRKPSRSSKLSLLSLFLHPQSRAESLPRMQIAAERRHSRALSCPNKLKAEAKVPCKRLQSYLVIIALASPIPSPPICTYAGGYLHPRPPD